MATTLEQQVALDKALVPSAQRLRIGRSNFRLPSDIQSKEPTLQVVYDVLRNTPFFKAFLVTADVPEIYKQEFWATAKLHQHSIRFKMDTRKHGLYHRSNVDYAYLIWEDFMYQVEHKNQKKSNEMYYPRFTKVIIDHFMTRKPSIPRQNKVNWHYVRDDVLFSTIKVVSRHQTTQQYGAILPIELTTEDIRNTKAYKEYYACATREATPKPKASARKKKGGSASSTAPPTPIATPTPTTTVVAAPRLSVTAKGKQPVRATTPTETTDVERTEAKQLKIVLRRSRQETHISQQRGSDTDEGTGSRPGVPDVPYDDSEEELSWNSSDDEEVDEKTKGRDESEGEKTNESDDDDDDQDEAEKGNDDNDDEEEISKIGEQEVTESDEGDDEATKSNRESEDEETREQEEESFDPIPRTPEESEDDNNNEEDQGLRIGEEERMHKEEEADELYRDVDINQGRGLQVSQETKDSHVILTPTQSDAQQESSSTSSLMTNLLNPTMGPGMESIFTTGLSTVTPIPSPQSTMTPSIISTFKTTSQLPTPPTFIPTNAGGRPRGSANTDRLQDSIQRDNDKFLKTIDDNMKKIIKEQVKTQVKAQVTRILPRIKESINAQLKAEVLTRSSHSSRTSYAVAADLSKMELKKILIDKMERNKSIQRSDEQRNLYKALVEAYDADKTILDTYEESAILKRRREDDDQEGPSAGSDRGSKRQREGGEHASASTPSEPAIGKEPVQTTCQMEEPSHPPSKPPTPNRDWNKSLTAAQGDAQSWISALAKQTNARSSFNELLDTPIDFSNFIMNRLGVDTLTPELLAGLTYELMRGSCQHYPHNLLQPLPLIQDNRGRRVIPFEHFINNDLEYLRGGASSRKYITSFTKTKAADYGHIKWIEELVPHAMWIQEPINYDKHALWGVSHWGQKRQQFYGFAVNRESALDVYSKRRIIAVTNLKIVEWHDYKHQDWISIHHLQLGVESYQKRLNLTKPDTYRSDLKRREAYTAHSNPRGFIYQNKDKKNILMRIDELHKFSDGTLNDVHNALDDRLKGIRMQYLPTIIWRKGDKDRSTAMIQAIDKMLKTRRIMRSLERFVGGRQYEGDF
nr:hypothetical protein [Tanacetum cinerariifolium]